MFKQFKTPSLPQMKQKLLYILPEFNPQTPTHYAHLEELLEKLGEKLEIFLLVERSGAAPKIKNINKVYSQRFNIFGLNLLEKTMVILWIRVQGYKTAYIHYSYWGAIFASLFMKTYYWHCEVYDQFSMPFEFSKKYLEKKLIDEWPMRLAMKTVSYLVTGTKTVGDYYRKEFNLVGSKVILIPNWVNPERFKIEKNKRQLRKELGLPPSKKIVIFVHRLAPRKGADYLPEIISSTISAVPNSWFFIAGGGGGTLKNWLEKEFIKNRLSSYVHLSAGIPNVSLPRYLAAADVLIMPSRQEGFPRVLIEAMAAGVPFVAMNVGGTKDIISPAQASCLVSVGDLEKFSLKIVKLLRDKKEWSALSKEGKIQVKKYSLDNVVTIFLEKIV